LSLRYRVALGESNAEERAFMLETNLATDARHAICMWSRGTIEFDERPLWD